MESYQMIKPLPSCRVSKRMVSQLESYLLSQLPKLLKRELSNMMELLDLRSPEALREYKLVLQSTSGTEEYASLAQHKKEHLPSALRRLTMSLKLGRPEILSLRLSFSRRGKPFLEISTSSQTVKANCARIHQQIEEIMRNWANGFWLLHNKVFQVLLTLSIPAAITFCGHWLGKDSVLLYFSQGWLLLLSVLLTCILTRIFPFVSFRSGRTLDVTKLFYIVLLLVTLSLIAGYTAILLLELQIVQ